MPAGEERIFPWPSTSTVTWRRKLSARTNAALTVRSLSRTSSQPALPAQPPDQPEKTAPLSATAVRVTRSPAVYRCAHVPRQSPPAALTVPSPWPLLARETCAGPGGTLESEVLTSGPAQAEAQSTAI